MPGFVEYLASRLGMFARWGGQGTGRFRVLLPGARFDYEADAGRLWLNGPVGTGIKWLGDQICRPRLVANRVSASGNHTPLPQHPAVALWKRPNPHYSGRTLSRAVLLSLVTEGDAFIFKRRNGVGGVQELWWIPPYDAAPLYPTDGSRYLDGWEFVVDGETIRLASENVIHIRYGIDPDNDRRGLSPLKALLRQVCGHNEAATYTAAILRNAGVPGLIVSPDANSRLDKGQDALIASRLDDILTGEGRGRTLALTGGVKVDQLGFNPDQMALDKLPAGMAAEILAALGTNAQTLGYPDATKTYENYPTAVRASWQNGVIPIAEVITDGLEIHLLPEFESPATLGRTVLTWDWSDVEALQEDVSLLHQRWRENYKEGVCTLNEAREAIGLDEHPDGDDFAPGKGPGTEPPDPMGFGPGGEDDAGDGEAS